jgi:hypothetical protein
LRSYEYEHHQAEEAPRWAGRANDFIEYFDEKEAYQIDSDDQLQCSACGYRGIETQRYPKDEAAPGEIIQDIWRIITRLHIVERLNIPGTGKGVKSKSVLGI